MDKWMSHPTALKIISVVVAMLLWAVVHLDQDTPATTVTSSTDSKTFDSLAIRAEGLDESQYALVAMEPSTVRLVVQGRRSELLTATNSDYQVKADLSSLGPGEHIVPLKADLPKGITVTEMSPSTARVEIVEIETKAFDVTVETEGTPANGYNIGTASLSSSTVNVVLPKDEMPFVGAVKVKVNVDGATNSVTNKKAQIVVYDTEGDEMTDAKVEPETVEVTQTLVPPSKELPLKVSYTGSMPDGVSIDKLYASESTVTVYAGQEVLDALDSYAGVVVDLSKLTKSGSMEVELKLLDGVVKTSPSKVTVTYTVDQAETRTFSKIPIAVTGLGSGLQAEWQTPEAGLLDVTVSGTKEVIDALQPGDIKLTADLSDLGEGNHQIELKADLPSFVYLNEGQELSGTVAITSAATTTEPPDKIPAQPEDGDGAEPSPGSSVGAFDPSEEESGDSGGSGNNAGTGSNSETETNAGTGNTGA